VSKNSFYLQSLAHISNLALHLNNTSSKHIRNEAYAGSVQAIQFTNNGRFLLTGIGPYFCVFHLLSGECLLRKHLFDDAGCIKGIKIISEEKDMSTLLALTFGQRKINVLRLNEKMADIQQRIQFQELNDWILDVSYLEQTENAEQLMAIGFGLNVVSIVQFSVPTSNSSELFVDLEIIKSVKGFPNCLLYSMRFYGNSLDELLIASGTIFAQISIWSWKKYESTQKLLLILNGHDVVIFIITWAKDGKCLCSISDDRTVRYWSFSHSFLENEKNTRLRNVG
jgi:WD40 repeat protein